ncbi:MAG: DUF4175 family protein [Planctomycetota bacterium]|jgi:hypothetical protein|nr:DUF4175 family protein [Planctomycetota bacterium]
MSVDSKLRGTWRKGRMHTHLRGGAHLISWVVVAFLFVFLADWTFDLPMLVRIPMTLVCIGFVAWLLRKLWWHRLERYNALRVAVRVEREYPELHSLLISYVELNSDQGPRACGSPELMGLVRNQAEDAAHGLNFRNVVSFANLRRLMAGALALVLVFGAFGALATDHMLIAAQRMLGADVPYPTKTRFVSITGDQLVRRGDKVMLAAEVSGRVPLLGTLMVRPLDDPDANWQQLQLDKLDGDRFEHELPHLAGSLAFRFAVGDAVTHRRDEHGTIEVVGPPDIKQTTIAITPPRYTGEEPRTAEDLSFAAPEGSTVVLDLQLGSAVTEATLVFEDGTEQAMELSAEGQAVKAEFTANIGGSYFVRWQVSAQGQGFSFDGTPRRLALEVDRAPVVTLRQPTGEIAVTTAKTLEMVFEAKDDYGIESMKIVYRVNGGEEFGVDLPALSKPGDQKHLAYPRFGVWPLAWRLRDELPYLKSSDEIVLQLEAHDVHAATGEARVGRSQELQVRVLSMLEYQQYITERFAEVQNRIAELKAKQKPIEVEVETLRKQVGSNKDKE